MKGRILICATASINVINITHYIVDLKQYFEEVNIILSPNSEKFQNPKLLESFCDKVYDSKDDFLNHVEISNEHDYVLVLPASANTIGKIANGICDNILTTVCISSYEKLYIFPNMNIIMWKNPFLQENIKKLKSKGIRVYIPQEAKVFDLSSKKYKENIVMPSVESLVDYIVKNDDQ